MSSDTRKPKPRPPAGLGAVARAFWRAVTERFVLEPHEIVLLREVVRVVDRLEDLHARVVAEGTLVAGKPHPALVEARMQETILGRLVVTLRLPEDWTQAAGRPQRRGAARGPYGSRHLKGVSNETA